MDKDEVFQRQISAAILQLRLRSPFFSTLALFSRVIPSRKFHTAATDGRNIYINPNFWRALTSAERLGLLAHEVLHAALLHVPRRGQRDPLLWNVAADIVVNGTILAEPGFVLPKGHLRSQQLEHLSVEEVYYKLHAQPNLQKLLRLLFADLLEPDGEFEANVYAELEQYWLQALQQARALLEAQGQGTLPAGLLREMAHLSPSQLDWRTYLWRFLVQTPTDFQGFDRRFVGQELYLDTLAGEKLRVFIALDTSGSINIKVMALFLSEVQAILGAYPHLEATLYYTDAACYGPYELSAEIPLPRPQGGGGTDFRPFFHTLEGVLDDPHNGVCIYLTDGYGSFPAQPPALQTLWVLSPGGIGTEHVPFGEAVRLLPEA
ncbi:vWA domain-containing protein [Dictyobacter aurantiacus]|uniref:Hydrolase n=1 Tax=Dictyobacter aurantiacus TaxID=1936993 RepID=A0A401ZM74_9CHLR|nr:VWA-like domain-containing protein [Dictyobacter aurantiacus]GCE07876.1 hydrolase [Dictyobacter aurantiacus]